MTITTQMTRRHLLTAASTSAILVVTQWPSYVSAQEIDTDAFLKLSQDLTQVDKLDADFAAAMLEAYETAGKGDAVAALVNGQGNDDLANDIVGKWYSGTSPNPDSEQVVTYTDAQMWYAMTYTKPMGYCGGGVGYWADVPEI